MLYMLYELFNGQLGRLYSKVTLEVSMKKEDRIKELEKQYIDPIMANKNLSNHERVKQKIKAKFKVEEIVNQEFPEKK